MRPWILLVIPSLVACSASRPDAIEDDAAELRISAFAYTCQSRTGNVMGEAQRTLEVKVSQGHLAFVGEHGPNRGTRDASYRAPSGTARARYTGFGWGDDCYFKLVVDEAALRGASEAQLRAQCSNDDEFRQDVYTCTSPRRTRLDIPEPPPPPPPAPEHRANATKWRCTTTDGPIVHSELDVILDEGLITLDEGDLDYTGVRDTSYRSRSGRFIGFEDFEWGGDCTLSAAAETKMLEPDATTGSLKVRCKGDIQETDVFQCQRR